MKGTNPLPPGTQNVAVNMPHALANALAELAKRSGVSRNKYCASVLNEAVEEGWLVRESSEVVRPDSAPAEPTSTPSTEHVTKTAAELRKRFKNAPPKQ
jgi:hypothetical protein